MPFENISPLSLSVQELLCKRTLGGKLLPQGRNKPVGCTRVIFETDCFVA